MQQGQPLVAGPVPTRKRGRDACEKRFGVGDRADRGGVQIDEGDGVDLDLEHALAGEVIRCQW